MCLNLHDRENAAAAIEGLHERYTLEGGPRPLVVKFADNNKRGMMMRVWQLTTIKPRTVPGMLLLKSCSVCGPNYSAFATVGR